MGEPDYILVSERSLVRRIRRQLRKVGHDILKEPGGRRYVADGERIVRWVDDLEEYAREVGCLKPWEYPSDE